MEFESRQFISQSEFNRSEKLTLTTIQQYVSIIVLLLALGDAVMLFVINGFVLNYITLSYAIINVLIVLICIGTLVWNNQQQNYLKTTEDEWGELTDNFNGRLLFFLTILMAIAEFVFFILIILSSDYIQGLYQSEKIGNDYQKFDKVVSVMKPIILIFSILIVVGLTYTIHNFYQMTISSITSRFNIYLLCIAASLTCWGSVYLLKGMDIYPISAILNLIILGLIVFAIISNTWKIKGLLMILAALQILIIPVLLGFQAQYIRDFQEQQESNIANCQQQMNNLSESYLSQHSCASKYIKDIQTQNCPNGEKECSVYSTTCDRDAQVQRWEEQTTDPADHPLGCLNLNCCKTVSNIYTKDLLILIMLSLATPLFLFALILFEFHLSRRTRSDKTLGRNIETLFLLLFIGTIVFGILLLVNNYTPIPLKKEVNFDQPAKAVKAKEFTKIQTRMCQSITQLVGSRVELSSECKSTTNCPLNKVETGKKETNILFGLWVKGVQQFKRKEATTYQTLAAAKFLWPNYDGNELDFFAIIGKLEYVQQYLDDVQVCYQVGSKDLTINLYQNVVDIPIEEKNSKVYHYSMFSHFADAAAKPTEPSKGSPTSPTTTDKGSSDPKSSATSTQPKCEIPNCQECKDQQCVTCKAGFDKDDERGCKFTGKLGVSESIQVQLFKEMKSKVSGFVVGEIKKVEDKLYTQYPLQEAKICWSQEGLEKPICEVASPKGEYKLQISTFDVADYSTQLFQPTTGLVTVAAIGYDDYVQSQVVQFQEEINFGTILLRSNVTIPKVQAAPPPKKYQHEAESTTTTTTKPTTTTEPAKPTTTKEPAKEQPKEPAKEQPKEPAKEQPKEPAKDLPKEPAKTEGGCKSGEYLDARKKCQPTGCTNVPFCKFCDKNNKCISCQAEYQLQADKSCLPENGCSKPYSQNQCLKCSTDKEKCDQDFCDAFSTFDNGQCKQAYKLCTTKIANCAICTKENKCAVCEQGYKVVNGECKLGDFSQIFQINYYETEVYVVDVMDWNHLESVKVDLRVGSCGSFQVYGTAKTDSNGKVAFTRLVKGSQYNLIVTHPDYSQNCYEFQDNEVTIVPLSKKLKSGQVRIVLEWHNPDINLDLQLSFNPTDTSNCLVGYLDNECTGAKFGKSSDEEYSFEAIEINALVLSKYLIFVQNFGDKENYQEKLIHLECVCVCYQMRISMKNKNWYEIEQYHQMLISNIMWLIKMIQLSLLQCQMTNNLKSWELQRPLKLNGQHGQQDAQMQMNLKFLNPCFLKMVYGGRLVQIDGILKSLKKLLKTISHHQKFVTFDQIQQYIYIYHKPSLENIQLSLIRIASLFTVIMNPENRDHYGFPKQNTQTPSKEEMLKINARIEKWRKMIPKIPQLMANNDSKLKSRLRKGIPEGIRMLIWPCLAEIDQMKIQAKRTYKELVESQEISPHDSQITLDVMRTFQTNDLIKMDTITSQSLFTVLRAISLTFQDMGYCQGLNYLAGSFLLLMNDELVYWHLYSLLTKYGCLDTYINPTNTLKYFYALDILVKQFLPDLHAKFTKFNIVPFYYAAEWFITLFSSILPMQIFLRVTDIFWHEHHKTTFRASLAILKIRKEEILTAKTMEQAITILKDQKFFNNYDPDKFIKIAMKDFIFSKKDLRKYYDQFAASQKK